MLTALLTGAAGAAGAQARPRPQAARPMASASADSAARVAAAWGVADRIDSARVHRDSAAAAPAFCADVRAAGTRGPIIGRDLILARIAGGTLAYTFVPVWTGALLARSSNDSTVVLEGRVRVVPATVPEVSGLWMRREFRRRPSGWCLVASEARL